MKLKQLAAGCLVAFVACAQTYSTVVADPPAPHNRDERVVHVSEMIEEHAEPVSPDESDAIVSVATPSHVSVSLKLHYAHLQSRAPGAPLLLLLHGDGSSIHEFDELYPHLPARFETFAFDQPNSGRSGDVSRETLRAAYPGAAYHAFEGLFFLRDVVDAFVRAVVRPVAGTRRLMVGGGSLGGNLGLLLVERAPAYPWLGEVVVWSPGSAWTDGGNKPLAAGVARERANRVWRMPDDRDAFLASLFCAPAVYAAAGLVAAPPQPWFWDWDCWGAAGDGCRVAVPELPCRTSAYPRMTRLKAQEIERSYAATKASMTAERAQWHYEMLAEQVELSHWSFERDGKTRYEHITRNTTLMAGEEDRFWPAALYRITRDLFVAASDAAPRGLSIRGRWLEQTGHSIHRERPTAVAKLLAKELP